jgi:hypothetical protein
VTQPDQDEGGATSSDDPLSRFLDGLHDHFATYRPQGSAAWNFGAAFRRLEEAWGRTFAADRARALGEDVDGGAAAGDAGTRSLSRRLAGRLTRERDEPSERPAEPDRTEEGFDAALEALRFLAARVDRLEREAAARARPLDGMAWFEPDDASGLLSGPIVEELAATALAGPVLHAECGVGELLVRLRAAGIAARGVDPRGGIALSATAGPSLDVEIGEALDALSGQRRGSLGAVVLAGVVDRQEVPQLLTLLDTALAAVAPGGPLVVVSRGPSSVAGWAAVAQDLLPGRPLHAETWELLLRRAGCTGVRRLEAPPGDAPGAYAVVGRSPA